MLRKMLVPACLVVVLLAFHACTLPEAVEIRGKPELSLPVNPDTANLSDMLVKNIKSSLESVDGIKVLPYENYNGTDIQTFLVQYDIFSGKELDFADDLEVLKDMDLSLNPEELSKEIELGDLGSLNDEMDPIKIDLDITDVIKEAEDTITDNFRDYTSEPLLIGINQKRDDLEYEPIKLGDFDTVTFTETVLKIKLYFDKDAPELPGLDIILTNVRITDGETEILGEGEDGGTEINLTAADSEKIVSFDFTDRTLKNKLYVTIERGEDHSSGDARDIDLHADPVVMSAGPGRPIIRGITGFEISETVVSIEETQIPMNFGDSGFIHAEIGSGNLSLNIELPFDTNPGNFKDNDFTSWATGFKIVPNLIVSQEQSEPDPDNNTWPGLNGTGTWEDTASPGNLVGKHINKKDVYILETSEITASTEDPVTKCSFMLNDEDLWRQAITVRIKPSLRIDNFTVVHIDAGDFVSKPEVDPISLGDAAEYLTSIEFVKVGVEIEFGRVDINGLEMMISGKELNINPSENYKEVKTDGTVEFMNDFPFPLVVRDGDNILVPQLTFDFDIRLKGSADKKVIAINNLDLSQGRDALKFEVLDVRFVYDWTSAKISNMPAVEGSYPEDQVIDMSSLKESLSGFIFEGAEAFLYTTGPDAFFELEPKMLLKAIYSDNDPQNELQNELLGGTVLTKASLPPNFDLDPGKIGKYTGDLPGGGMLLKDFDKVLANLPGDLRFKYDVMFDEITITPDQLDGYEPSDTMSMFLLAVIPMSLRAESDGAAFVFPEMFEEKDDIFDREPDAESSLLDSITSLRLKLELTHTVFNGGTLALKDTGSGHTIKFPRLSGKVLDLPFTGKDLEYINSTSRYKPEIGIEFKKGDTVQIPQHLGVRRIEFSAGLKHRIEM